MKIASFIDRLNAGEILVADGATGTNLQRLGLPSGVHPEDWVLDEPGRILMLEEAFVDAGSDIILTCTFGATRIRLKGAAHAADVIEINKTAADLARRAASTRAGVLVGGSIGPLGQLLKPYGPLTPEEAGTAYTEQARALAEGGVDLVVIETQYALGEMDAALAAVKAVTDLPVVVSFSFDRGTRTIMGVRPSEVAGRYAAAGPAMIGANCGTTLENMQKILGEYGAAAPEFPLWAKPNAGLPRLESGQTVYDVSPAQMAEFTRRAAKLGACVVGGCCGSTPEHIAAMAEAVRSTESNP
jgi:5-methyltetrahydrofolate--homocysteine methyltransferase